MIKVEFMKKVHIIDNFETDSYFINSIIKGFLLLRYSVSDGNAERCLLSYLKKIKILNILDFKIKDGLKDVIY